MVKNRFKKIISKDIITKINNKYDEHGSVNNNMDRGRSELFNAQETRVIVRAVRKDRRITGVAISTDKKLNIYEASTST